MQHELAPSRTPLCLSLCLPLPAVNFYVVAVSVSATAAAAAAAAASARWTRLPKCFVLFCFDQKERERERVGVGEGESQVLLLSLQFITERRRGGPFCQGCLLAPRTCCCAYVLLMQLLMLPPSPTMMTTTATATVTATTALAMTLLPTNKHSPLIIKIMRSSPLPSPSSSTPSPLPLPSLLPLLFDTFSKHFLSYAKNNCENQLRLSVSCLGQRWTRTGTRGWRRRRRRTQATMGMSRMLSCTRGIDTRTHTHAYTLDYIMGL